jgi:hypothetical protein
MIGVRAPRLRAAVPRDRLRVVWAGRGGEAGLRAELAAFRAELAASVDAARAPFAPPPKRAEPLRERVPVE